MRRDGDEWVIETAQGEIRCEYVVNAAGYRAKEVGKLFGRDIPMMVMSHQYILFEEIPELAAWTKENGKKLPLLRDVDTSYYLRQEKNGMNLGPYERNCRAHWASAQMTRCRTTSHSSFSRTTSTGWNGISMMR